MEYPINQAEQDWVEISKRLDKIEPIFKQKLQRSITSTVSSDQVNITFSRKTFQSAYEKCVQRGYTLNTLYDLLRARVLYSRRVDPERIVSGIEKLFGKGNIESIERKEVASQGREYFGSIHMHVIVDGQLCEIQIMRKNLGSYLQNTRSSYKDTSGKRTDLNEKQRNIEKRLFEKVNKPQDIKVKEFEPEIEIDAAVICAVELFLKMAKL